MQCECYSSTTKGEQKRALQGDYSNHRTGSVLVKENEQGSQDTCDQDGTTLEAAYEMCS